MPPFGPLVDASWLSEHLHEVVVADVRWYLDGRSGRAAYEAGHLPGAVFVDLDTVLAARPGDGPGRHPLPAPDDFAAAMSELGIGDGVRVVAYDDASGSVDVAVYCGSGVTARFDLLALEVAGLPGGQLYEGSWSHWSSDPARPAETV